MNVPFAPPPSTSKEEIDTRKGEAAADAMLIFLMALAAGKNITFAEAEAEAAAAAGRATKTECRPVCFPAGTPVHTTAGLKPIECIAAGDRVWSYNHRELRWVEREVVETFRLQHRGTMTTLRVKDETMRATGGHPFWVVRGECLRERPSPTRIAPYETDGRQQGRWVLACDLRPGDEVLLRTGELVALDSVELNGVIEQVFIFHVAELQNYAVGDCGILVHNTNDPPPQSAKGTPKPSPNFEPPTNPPQLPPTEIPPGWRVREMPPTEQYPNGYWKLEKPMADGSWQPIDPSTMKPGGRPQTHVPLPPPSGGE